MRRLTLYRLRAKVEIAKRDQALVAVSWGADSGASQTDSSWLRDTRFPQPAPVVARLCAASCRGRRIRSRLACASASRTALPKAAPTMRWATPFRMTCCSTRLGGVGFRKGCYVGQEVVSRMQHRGTARRRVLIVSRRRPCRRRARRSSPDGRAIGTLGSVGRRQGLAIAAHRPRQGRARRRRCRSRRAACRVALAIPAWATFTFPSKPPAAEEA